MSNTNRVGHVVRTVTTPLPDAREIWDSVRANTDKLRTCEVHQFGLKRPSIGERTACIKCGGEMGLSAIHDYCRGYKAAGKDPTEVAPWFK